MNDVLIVGQGPAGISAALYTARAGLKTVIVGGGIGALEKAERVENFYGSGAQTGKAIAEAGIKQALNAGAKLRGGEAVGLSLEEFFTVNVIENAAENIYEAKTIILATGASRAAPGIRGLKGFEGSGVSYCAVCDAFFYRGKPVAVLGGGIYALHEANELLPVAGSVAALTNGKPPEVEFPEGVMVYTERIAGLTGGQRLEYVQFENGEELRISGLFIAIGTAGSTELAKKIGAVTGNGHITVDGAMRTSVPGLFAAGDCTGGMKQIAKAVYEGAVAGTEAVKYLRGL